MSLKTNIEFKNDILFVKISGIWSLEEAKDIFKTIIESLKIHITNKILIDTTEIEKISRSIFQAYDYARFVSKEIVHFKMQGDKRNFRFAYLYHMSFSKVLKFGELVAINRGMKTKAFVDYEDALRWLEKE